MVPDYRGFETRAVLEDLLSSLLDAVAAEGGVDVSAAIVLAVDGVCATAGAGVVETLDGGVVLESREDCFEVGLVGAVGGVVSESGLADLEEEIGFGWWLGLGRDLIHCKEGS